MAKIWILKFAFLSLLEISFCRIGFIKDQSLDAIQFPPKYQKRMANQKIPFGHLRPLGWQRPPEGKVQEEESMMYPEDFYKKYINTSQPVVFRRAISDVPAMEKWKKDDYLRKQYGSLNIHVVVKKELFTQGPKVMTFKNFLKEYNFDDWYLTNIIPQEMMSELVFPKCLKCGVTPYLQESGIWMSSGGTASLLHSHADHNLHCVLSGKKDFILMDPKHKDKVYYHQEKEIHRGEGHSDIPNMDRLNMFKFKKIYDVPWTWASLYAGDCMFIPATYMHQVRSYGRSFSSTILWAPSPEVDFSKCPARAKLDTVLPLNDAPFIWTYLKADRELSNIRLNAASLRHHLKVWMRNEDSLRYDVLKDYYDEIMSELKEADKPPMADLWSTLTGKKDLTAISREGIMGLSDAALEAVAEYLNRPHALHDHKEKQAKDTKDKSKEAQEKQDKGKQEKDAKPKPAEKIEL